MSREERILTILNNRKPFLQKITATENSLKVLDSSINDFCQFQSNVLKVLENNGELDKKIEVEKINLNPVLEDIQKEFVELINLKHRFQRDTINIAVVGRARQGKSRLLQSISGLSASEIPDGSGSHCTGVKSSIFHKNSLEKAYANVYFFSEGEFFNDVILPYYKKLKLAPIPYSLVDFTSNPLVELNSENTLDKAIFENLKKYHSHFDLYSSFLTKNSIEITREEIREFVAQDSIDGSSKYYDYLAVKSVEIFANFPHNDIGKICLIDMPGLGDTNLADESRIIEEVGKNVDFILFVKKPEPTGAFWSKEDVELYSLASTSMSRISLKDSSFMILNNMKGSNDNLKNCQALASEITSKHINVSNSIIVDASSDIEVGEKIIDVALDYISKSLSSIDDKILNDLQKSIKSMQSRFLDEKSKTESIFSKSNTDNMSHEEFLRKFRNFWNDFNKKINLLIKSLRDKVDQNNPNSGHFYDEIERIIQKTKESVISHKEKLPQAIETLMHTHGGPGKARDEAMHMLRTSLSKEFFSLDDSLDKEMIEMKLNVIKILKELGVNKFLDNPENENVEGFFNDLISKMDNIKHKTIKLGFEYFRDFKLSYRGIIHNKIRKILNKLDPESKIYINGIPNFGGTPEEITEYMIESIYSECLYECHNTLKDFESEPLLTTFTITEEFRDRVIRAENNEDEWNILLQEYKTYIWEDDFKTILENKNLIDNWNNKIKNINEMFIKLIEGVKVEY